MLSIRAKSSEGCSLFTQHLNCLGGILGLIVLLSMSDDENPSHKHGFTTYVVYFNSVMQALSIYAVVVYFDGWEKLWNSIYEINVLFAAASRQQSVDSHQSSTTQIQMENQSTVSSSPIITIGGDFEIKRKVKNGEQADEEHWIQTPDKKIEED